MSATLGDADFYQAMFQYIDQNNQSPFMSTIDTSFLPHDAEKHTLDHEPMSDDVDPKRRGPLSFLTCLTLIRIHQFTGNGLWIR
jgi:hypothetical protein